jgi:hypothetical protein
MACESIRLSEDQNVRLERELLIFTEFTGQLSSASKRQSAEARRCKGYLASCCSNAKVLLAMPVAWLPSLAISYNG